MFLDIVEPTDNVYSEASVQQPGVTIPAEAASATLRLWLYPMSGEPASSTGGVYAGSTINLQFGAYNDGADGVTAMYVDDVSLEICYP